jgi:RnfABCDGE-type electron transport complex C subunit
MSALHKAEALIWDIPGGIHPAERKELSNRTPIQPAPLPKRLTLPLNQHIGAPAEPVVAVGERVLKGQLIAAATGFVSVPVHAPTSGTVSFIGPQPYPHVSGMLAPAIVIDSDGLDEWIELTPCADYRQLENSALVELIRQAGISGLGGAGFPTAVKLNARPTQKTHTLIINGTECEPYITADDLLMRERASELISGIDILVQLIQPDQVLIGIEDNKPEAIAAVRHALAERSYQLKVFPTKYPSGGEKQLIQILTGVEVPSGGLPADIGMLCQNVGTCVATHNAVVHGKPLISRITTLTGEALAQPMNVEVLLGTPVGELLEFAGLNHGKLNRLIMGGPMMGFTLPDFAVPGSRPPTACWLRPRPSCHRRHRPCRAFAVVSAPRPARPACCRSSCIFSPSARNTSSSRHTTCSTVSNAAPAPMSARRASLWCSTTARPRARFATSNRNNSRPNSPSSVSNCARNACAAPKSRRKPNARPAPPKPRKPRRLRLRPHPLQPAAMQQPPSRPA